MSKETHKFNVTKESNERTLGRIAEFSKNLTRVNTFGVVVDKAKYQCNSLKESSYVVLKIIDPSFNSEAIIDNQELRFQNFITVYIYNDINGGLPEIDRVGDVIRLRRFDFKFNSLGEIIGESRPYSNWMTFACTLTKIVHPTSKKEFKNNKESENTIFEVEIISKLIRWGEEFFTNRSLRNVLWWRSPKEPTDENEILGQTAEKIDLILKVVRYVSNIYSKKSKVESENEVESEISEIEDEESGHIKMIDDLGNKYVWDQSPPGMKGKFLKFSKVNIVFTKKGRVVKTLDSTSLLLIPDKFLDCQLFDNSLRKSN